MTIHTLIENDEFNIRGEFLWFGVILHADVHVPWSMGVRKRFKRAVQEIARTFPNVFSFWDRTQGLKLRKFIQLAGGRMDHYRQRPCGEWVEVYRFSALD